MFMRMHAKQSQQTQLNTYSSNCPTEPDIQILYLMTTLQALRGVYLQIRVAAQHQGLQGPKLLQGRHREGALQAI